MLCPSFNEINDTIACSVPNVEACIEVNEEHFDEARIEVDNENLAEACIEVDNEHLDKARIEKENLYFKVIFLL